MAVTRQNVVNMAPELATIVDADTRWADFLADAEALINRGRLGDTLADMAVKNLVAHWMTESIQEDSDGAATGQIKSVTVGPVTTTYETGGSSSADASEFSGTQYGRRYLKLLRLGGAGMTVG